MESITKVILQLGGCGTASWKMGLGQDREKEGKGKFPDLYIF